MELFLIEIYEVVVNFSLIREGGVELEDFVLDGVAELDAGVVLGRVPEIGACGPNEGEDEDHGAACVGIEVAHLIKILSGGEFCKEDVEDVDAALH